MISGSVAKTNSDTTTGSLSYINNLVTGATSSGSYNISVSNRFMNDTMATLLRSYGYNVTTNNDYMGTNNDYVITWGTINVPTATPTATATSTPVPTATPTPTPIALDFTISSYCEQSPKMLTINVSSILGGTSSVGYQISKTTFSSQADAEANTEWLNVVANDILTTAINGTYWVSVKDSSGTVKAKSTSVSCFPTPTPTATSTPTPTPTATPGPTPTATVGPTPTPTSLYQSYNYSISATDLAAATGNTGGNAQYNNKVVVVITNGYNCGNTTERNFTFSFDTAGSAYNSWLISRKTNVPVLGYYQNDTLVTTGLISTQTANPSVPC
jgi:hypothetical protein